MNTNWPTKKLGEMKKAWIVQWGYYAQNEEECLRRLGIKKKIVDVISIRRCFDKQIIEIAKDIYKREILSFSEKIYLSNYSKGEKRKKEFFGGTVPIFTHYNSNLYRNLMETINEQGLDSKEVKELSDKWNKYPRYIIVGHNPYLKIKEVLNLVLYEDDNGREILEWVLPLPGGNRKKEKYEFK